MVATASEGSSGQDHESENMAFGLQESRNIKRGDIFWATFSVSNRDASEGSGPVLIIQNNVGNEHSSTVIAAMITSRLSKRIYPVNVRIPEGVLPKASEVKLHQLHTLDKRQLGGRMARLSLETMAIVDDALSVSLGLPRGG